MKDEGWHSFSEINDLFHAPGTPIQPGATIVMGIIIAPRGAGGAVHGGRAAELMLGP